MESKEDKIEQATETKQEPFSRFKNGSIYERWAEDEDNFIKCFSRTPEENNNDEE